MITISKKSIATDKTEICQEAQISFTYMYLYNGTVCIFLHWMVLAKCIIWEFNGCEKHADV